MMALLAMPAIILLSSAGSVHADAPAPLADAEKIYWDCEFAAGGALLELAEAEACSEAYEYLKKHKFQGDFQRFMVWWQDNRQSELSRRRTAAPPPIRRFH